MMMARRKKLLIGLGPVLLLLLAWVLMGMPLRRHQSYGCEVCRAWWHRESRYGIPMSSCHKLSEFSRYYIKHIDPHHKHHWRFCAERYLTVRHVMYADGQATVWMIPEQAELAIVKALPDQATRRAFCEQFDAQDYDGHQWDACFSLCGAYDENPNRSDWIKLIKKLGLYPKAADSAALQMERARAARRPFSSI